MEEQFLSSAAWCAARRPASTLPDDPHLTLTLTLVNDPNRDPGPHPAPTLPSTLTATLTRCARFLRGAPPTDAASRAALRSHVVCGCNFPPSQFQLHLQYFLMPWLPSHYKAFT